MDVRGDFLGPPHCTTTRTLLIKVSRWNGVKGQENDKRLHTTPENRISHCPATNARQKTVFFENLFVVGFHQGAFKTGRVTLKNLQNSHR